MMAACRAGELGAKTVLLEKNKSLGKKLLLTGKGRSNLAKAEFNPKELVKKYGRQGDFLLYPLSIFGVKEIISFFEKKGLKTKTERGKRIFPESGQASDVLAVLIDYLKLAEVKIITEVFALNVNFVVVAVPHAAPEVPVIVSVVDPRVKVLVNAPAELNTPH